MLATTAMSSAIPLSPFQSGYRVPVFALTGADLFDDSVRNQDSGSEALDQVEAGDTREENKR
jgi:hypothetical protein